jgi:50S ribosomal protein L16 3-hydroxylase
LRSRKPIPALDVDTFLRRYWQRAPLLVRGAFPRFADPLSMREVLALAATREAQSRLVRHSRSGNWTLEHGPFSRARLKQLPRRDWTILVQDTNHFSAHTERLLARFDFIPHARVDDLMVSYAVPGGTVGPHLDSYDVFLLQGSGRRRWQISHARDDTFVPGLPLKILRRFVPDEEWVLEPGDMLYLPPHVAHHGVAESECLTWSIGFRAPSNDELVQGFLDHLRDTLEVDGRYRDAGMQAARHSGKLPAAFVAHAERTMESIAWTRKDVRDFAGRFLSEPKAHVFFDPPPRPLTPAAFTRRAAASGLVLDRRSRFFFSGSMFYMNGEAVRAGDGAAALRALADARRIPGPVRAPHAFWQLVHRWYAQGFLHARAEEEE